MVWRLIVSSSLAGLIALASVPALGAERGGSGPGLFDAIAAMFNAPARKEPPPQIVTSKRPAPTPVNTGDPMYPYSGGGGEARPRAAATYRTICVRLCDGFYWPSSEASPESKFRKEDAVCERSCQAEARLFFAAKGESDAAEYKGLDGKPYASLANAFLYRKALQPQCGCRPSAWDDTEIARHRQYAIEQKLKSDYEAMNAPAPQTVAAAGPDIVVEPEPVAADGALPAMAEPLVKPKRKPKPVVTLLPGSTPGDPLGLGFEAVDKRGQRYIPLR